MPHPSTRPPVLVPHPAWATTARAPPYATTKARPALLVPRAAPRPALPVASHAEATGSFAAPLLAPRPCPAPHAPPLRPQRPRAAARRSAARGDPAQSGPGPAEGARGEARVAVAGEEAPRLSRTASRAGRLLASADLARPPAPPVSAATATSPPPSPVAPVTSPVAAARRTYGGVRDRRGRERLEAGHSIRSPGPASPLSRITCRASPDAGDGLSRITCIRSLKLGSRLSAACPPPPPPVPPSGAASCRWPHGFARHLGPASARPSAKRGPPAPRRRHSRLRRQHARRCTGAAPAARAAPLTPVNVPKRSRDSRLWSHDSALQGLTRPRRGQPAGRSRGSRRRRACGGLSAARRRRARGGGAAPCRAAPATAGPLPAAGAAGPWPTAGLPPSRPHYRQSGRCALSGAGRGAGETRDVGEAGGSGCAGVDDLVGLVVHKLRRSRAPPRC